MKLLALPVCALAALTLAACGEGAPKGREVAGAMPDTNAPRAPDPMMTAPDAGVTGAAEPVPAQGGAGNAAGATVPNPEAAGNS